MDIVIRSIENYPRYFIAADGRMFRELNPTLKENGYMYAKLVNAPYTQKHFFVHRLVAEAWIGPPPDPSFDVDHGDGVRHHNHVDNLEWCTRTENLARARRRGGGHHRAGEKNHHAKLTEDQVLEIRKRVAAGESNLAVAQAFGVSDALVCKIKKRKIWTHI